MMMKRLRRHLTYANVMATIAVFFSVSFGTAWALGENTVGSKQVRNFKLNDQDVGQGTFVNFETSIGSIGASDCGVVALSGIDAKGDHLLLTPSWQDANIDLDYTITYQRDAGYAYLSVCNRTDSTIDDGKTHFNLLVFDAQ